MAKTTYDLYVDGDCIEQFTRKKAAIAAFKKEVRENEDSMIDIMVDNEYDDDTTSLLSYDCDTKEYYGEWSYLL